VEQLKQLVKKNQPAGEIANEMGRTVEAILLKAKLESLGLNSARSRRSGYISD
jgi:hypothetical protein